MRQGQQNRRGRNRSGGRKPQSALSRNFESNGPNVKIRGSAAHIAEKYVTLARDALSSGDIIVAESYLQHAEHYNRIIMAAQGERPNGAERQASAGGNGRDHGDDFEQDDEDEEPAPRQRESAPQPAPRPRDHAPQPAQQSAPPEADAGNKRRRRKPANGADGPQPPREADGDVQKGSRNAPSRRARPKSDEAPGTKPRAANGASAGSDDVTPNGFTA